MGGFIFYAFDAVLLALCAVLLWRMPDSPSEAPPASDTMTLSWAPILGVIALVRGGWRMFGVFSAWAYFMGGDAGDSSATLQLMMVSIVLTTLALLVVGLLAAQRSILQRIQNPGTRNMLGEIVGACWGYRRAIGIGAALLGGSQLLPLILFR